MGPVDYPEDSHLGHITILSKASFTKVSLVIFLERSYEARFELKPQRKPTTTSAVVNQISVANLALLASVRCQLTCSRVPPDEMARTDAWKLLQSLKTSTIIPTILHCD
jgi:hypothetical protein